VPCVDVFGVAYVPGVEELIELVDHWLTVVGRGGEWKYRRPDDGGQKASPHMAQQQHGANPKIENALRQFRHYERLGGMSTSRSMTLTAHHQVLSRRRIITNN